MRYEKCGVYQILCVKTGESYVGSSRQVYTRFSQHRSRLRRGAHHACFLQQAWNLHGEDSFTFSILEECLPDQKYDKEQIWIDKISPMLNWCKYVYPIADLAGDALARRTASLRARAKKITHCPRGHAYTEKNTYLTKSGKRVCRACNAIRVAAVIAKQSPEQRQRSRARSMEIYWEKWTERRAKQKQYSDKHKSEKREYDRLYRERCKVKIEGEL